MTEPMNISDLAKAAYEAYGDVRGWRVVGGAAMPQWDDQSQELREAWMAAADAAVEPYRRAILNAITGTRLADHLGDVRDEENELLAFMSIPELPYDHPAAESESAFRRFQARVIEAGLVDLLPKHARDVDDDDEDDDG